MCWQFKVSNAVNGELCLLGGISGYEVLRTFAARPKKYSETLNAGIKSLYLTPPIKPKPNVCIESMPPEVLLKIFSCLDAVSLLAVGCVNKRFYELANDNGIWLKLYSSSLHPKWTIWKMKSKQTETLSLGCAAVNDKKPGYWKKEYISKQTSDFRTRDKNGKEHVIEKPNLSFKDTSVTVLWHGTDWPCLDILSTLKVFGVTPLLPDQSIRPNKNGPRRFSLIAEYHLANLTEKSVVFGADELVQLFSLSPGLLVGIWKEKNEIAFVMANLHYNQLLERSILGSATVQYAPPPNKPLLDDIDSEYGLHDYSLHLDLHGRNCMYLCGSFKCLFCRKRDIENGYLRLRVVNLKDNRKHLPIIGTLGICWETDVFKGNVKDCFVMDLTLLDETGKPFWCFSAPVHMELSTKSSGLYDYMGHMYTADYADSEGKVHVQFVWLEETKEYIIVSLVLYVSAKKVHGYLILGIQCLAEVYE
ncbi:F-box only protein 15 [Lonchura striata]|uniref:F-box only protein 15 n=1 Tax=Lonchura striata TaxID=40157 RepID=A0A218VEF6_9PASE|nr:F-box only protein 15 [Lonchura striata domestica]